MNKPKFSEILRAAARGCMEPYGGSGQLQYNHYGVQGPQPGQGYQQIGQAFNSSDYQRAKELSGMLNAMAMVYEQYEQ